MFGAGVRFFLALPISCLTLVSCGSANPETCDQSPVEVNQSLSSEIDSVVDAAVECGFAGGVAVMKNGEFVYRRVAGSASLREDIPVTNETLFHVASITKYFTAVLVLKAVEEERFALSDSISVIAPDTNLADRGVTFLDLLTHQSGLGSTYIAEKQHDGDDAVSAIDNTEIDESKVGAFRYSNDGYDLLGALLERVYGIPYEEILQTKIFEPAGLEHASHWSLVDITDPEIVGQPLQDFPKSLRKRNYGMVASAGLLITAADLVAFQSALMEGKLLNESSIAQLHAPHGEISIGQATAGAFLNEHPVLGARLSALGVEDWGDNAAMRHYLDKDIIIAIVTSRGTGDGGGDVFFRDQISDAIENLIVKIESES